MSLKTKVKISNITNLSDARYCSGMGVDFLGFPLAEHTKENDLKQLKDITAWVSGPTVVVELNGDQVPRDIAFIIQNYNAGMIQIHASMLRNLPAVNIPLIVSLDVRDWQMLKGEVQKTQHLVAYILLTAEDVQFLDFENIDRIANDFDVLLGYGITEKNIDLILLHPVKGVALNGSSEEKPGLKEYTSLAGILEKLEID